MLCYANVHRCSRVTVPYAHRYRSSVVLPTNVCYFLFFVFFSKRYFRALFCSSTSRTATNYLGVTPCFHWRNAIPRHLCLQRCCLATSTLGHDVSGTCMPQLVLWLHFRFIFCSLQTKRFTIYFSNVNTLLGHTVNRLSTPMAAPDLSTT